ncbi:hypothetical protein GQ53DRAFT_4362 [Thozetella sp. PMI_491]|nr:hypothetical protein GQ53DRAFT_4362 [Thozetella sp. PMI_491]
MRNQLSPAPHRLISQHTSIDHAGNQAISIYRGLARAPTDRILPPLFSFQVYVTFGGSLADVAPRFINQALADFGPSDVVRFDMYTLSPGSSTADVVTHYRAEREARRGQPLDVVESYAGYHGDYVSIAIVIASEAWETVDGVNFVLFDPPPATLEREDRDAILGVGASEDGVLVLPVSLEGYNRWSVRLRDMAEKTNLWFERAARYEEAFDAGQVEWSLPE